MKIGYRSLVLALVGVATVIGATAAIAQDLHSSRRSSPMGMARTHIGDAYVFVVYSRPYLRGRDNIFGTEASEALVPFGKVWRTGANEATQITTTADLVVGDAELPAGTYSMFTTPGEESWTVHFNAQLGMSGTGMFADGEFTPVDLTDNVADATVMAGELTEEDEVDQMTIAFEDGDDGTVMAIRWARTEVLVPVSLAD